MAFKPLSTRQADDPCPQCGGPMTWRQEHPNPVLLQLGFAVSFVAFLIWGERLRQAPVWLWAWTGAQAGLGLLLIRGRIRARKRTLRCVRCSPTLR